ncbi:hypothetical protein F4778DRAFT_381557 [Xylariomycetidae sp. FL2044]|nr:hypothetical protein F4778DRAFT_381557 [Xylariomycetidae sp. FL2044]
MSYVKLYGALWILDFLLGIAVAVDDYGVRWRYPTEGSTFFYEDTVNVTYTSPFEKPLLYTFCTSTDGKVIQRKKGEVTPYNGTAPILLDWPEDGEPCWFNLRPNATQGTGSNSPTIGYVLQHRDEAAGSTSSSITWISSSTNTVTEATSTSSPTVNTFSTSIPLYTSTPTAAAASSWSTGAQAGLGVGVGLVGVGPGGFAAIFFFRRRKTRSGNIDMSTTPNAQSSGMPPALSY